MERILAFADALAAVLEASLTQPAVTEVLSLTEAAQRVLAKAIQAPRDQPPFDRSTRDGFAIRAGDRTEARKVLGLVRAGERWDGSPLCDGETIEIMTGAPLPAGADAVVMIEHVRVGTGLTLEAGRSLRAGENVVPRGAEARAGDIVLPVGRLLGAAEIAVAASCGCRTLEVFARPKVAIVATGDELVEVSEDRAPGQAEIYNSNSYALAALVQNEGGLAVRLPIAQDTREQLTQRLTAAEDCDLLLLSGGVSMGKFDLVEQVLAERGAEFFFTGVLIQPGKPIVFGRLPRRGGQWTYFFGLPGNPVSTQVCFHLFVAPLLRALAGRAEVAPQFVEARLAEDVKGGAKVTRFLPAEITGHWDGVMVKVVGWQGSGDVTANARGNGYAVLPMGVAHFAAGETVRVLLR